MLDGLKICEILRNLKGAKTFDMNIQPDWRWGTPEGSREFDRLTDGLLTLDEKLQWLEEMENFTLMLHCPAERENPALPDAVQRTPDRE